MPRKYDNVYRKDQKNTKMKSIIIAFKFFLLFTVITGIIYPLIITGIAQTLFPVKANGSLILHENKVIGSELIGQQFDSSIYFSSRPSAISYNPLPSGGSNYGLTNTKLNYLVNERRHEFLLANQLDSNQAVPSEMLFASASGIDPHISVKAALLQSDKIAKARNFSSTQKNILTQIIMQHIEPRQFFIFGEERVNVLLLNLDIDKIR